MYSRRFSRRNFLKLGVAAGVVGAFPRTWATTRTFAAPPPPAVTTDPTLLANLTKFTESLQIPPVLDMTGGGTLALEMKSTTHFFHSAFSALGGTPAYAYGDVAHLGPTIVTRRGVPIEISFVNNLGPHPLAAVVDTSLHGATELDRTGPRVTTHLHGGYTSAASDGEPEDTFRPGEGHASGNYRYDIDQQAANLWYHDHALGITRLNVMAGLAGGFLIRDSVEDALNLPSGPYEMPLIIQDRMFNADGTFKYPIGILPDGPWAPEFFGDVATVNGVVWPNLTVDRGWYRFRIYNGSNARFYNLRIQFNGTPQPRMFQIGTDSGLLNAPVAFNNLLFGPGERADVLIDFSLCRSGGTIRVTNDAVSPFPTGPRGARRGMALGEIMQFTIGPNAGATFALPANLRPAEPVVPLQPASAATVRNVSLVEAIDPVLGAPRIVLLNNLRFQTDNRETPQAGTIEQWNIINTTEDAHTIHLHLVQVQLLNRQRFDRAKYLASVYGGGVTPGAGGTVGNGPWPVPSADAFGQGSPQGPGLSEIGWKDTFRANPGEITRILVPFGGANAGLPNIPFGSTTTHKGRYVWHCHLLEHEDNEMMLPYEVV